jgi:uncharacterized Zn finger protein
MTLAAYLTNGKVKELALPSNFKYGSSIFRRGAVKFIDTNKSSVEAWVGGLDGTVAEGGGSRRRTTLSMKDGDLSWRCTGNPESHQIFCKHGVALALAIQSLHRKGS